MSKVLWLVGRNIPLGHHEKYGQREMDANPVYGMRFDGHYHASQKLLDSVVATIVNGLSQYSVADLIAREWNGFPPQVRMGVTQRVAGGGFSGNVTKGIAYLDKLLGGKLRRQEDVRTERVLRVGGDGRLVRNSRRVNQVAASASQAFAIVTRPAGYNNMSPQQKRRIQEELARARRNR